MFHGWSATIPRMVTHHPKSTNRKFTTPFYRRIIFLHTQSSLTWERRRSPFVKPSAAMWCSPSTLTCAPVSTVSLSSGGALDVYTHHLIIYQKEVYYRLGIWHRDLTKKLRPGEVPCIVSHRDDHWSSTIPRMVTHHPKSTKRKCITDIEFDTYT